MSDAGATTWSLRRRLVGFSLAAALAVWLTGSVAIYAVAVHETGEVFDSAMIETGELLLSFAQHEYAETGTTSTPVVQPAGLGAHPYLHYQVWTRSHRLLLRSHDAPEAPLSARFREGLRDETVGDSLWRVYVVASAGGELQIQIGEPYTHRREVGHRVIFALVAAVLLGFPALLALLWWVIRRVSVQLAASAQEIGQRSAADLSPLSPRLLPGEFAPLIDALNSLLARLAAALAAERRFTADASHELRTPLAVIKTQAQVAQRAKTPEAVTQALGKLEAGVERAAHLLEQLLTAARLEPMMSRGDERTRIDVRREAQEQLEDYRELIAHKRLRVSVEAGDSGWTGNPALARILIRNLLDNALRYTPAGGEVRLRYALEPARQLLEVSDTGPGIPPAERSRIFDRFYRIPGTAETGSGLGLAIARDIVEAQGGHIEIDEGIGGGGVSFRVVLPRDAA